ncbi:MAG: cirA 3 [Firmicutes bacterium]|nr:cirA 3 [Bacillota bacterium]
MRKKIIANLALVNCVLLMLPSLVGAQQSEAEDSETVNLGEAVVSAVPLEKYLVTTSVITDKDIAAKGARNLAEALADVPGLNLHQGKKGNVAVDIRGVTSTDVKIYVDGVLVNPLAKMTSSSAVDASIIPVDNIAKIEVIKGPAPVIYGTDAKGGVILITTKNGSDYQGGNVSLAAGTWGSLNGAVSYGGGDKKFNYFFDVGSERTDGYRSVHRDTKNVNTKLNWTFDNDAVLTFTGGYSTTDKDCQNAIDPVTGKVVTSTTGFWPGLNNWQYRDWERSNLSLDYTKKVNSKLDYDVKVYRFTENNGLWANGTEYTSATLASKYGYSTTRWNASYWDSTLTGVELSANWKLNDRHLLTFGTLYNDIDWKKSDSDDDYNPDDYYWLDYKNKRYGYYLQDTIQANERTTFILGVRHDKNEVINTDNTTTKDSATNPTVNVLYQLDAKNTLRTAYGQTYSFPSAEALYTTTYGNPDLKPEKSKNYEIGWKHEFNDTLTGDFAIFKNDIVDKIDRLKKYYYNLDWAKIKGIELEFDKQFSTNVKGYVNYTYLDTASADYSGTVTTLTYTPRNHVNYGLSYQASKGYNFDLTGHWVGRRYTGDSTGSDTRSTSVVYSKLPSYNLIDLKISRQVSEKQDWYITVYNIFNKHYEEELFYPDPGIWMMIGTNYKI